MSIARMVTRLATVFALKGNTIAEDRVKDSEMTDLQHALEHAPATVVMVYTDDSQFAPEQGKRLFGGQGSTTLVLIIAVVGVNKLREGEYEFSFPATDHATEISLDMLERQIQAALMDPDNPWSQVWRGIVSTVTKWTSRRASTDKSGVRYAARQILIEIETVSDPIPGRPVEGEWRKFLDLLGGLEDDRRALAEPLEMIMTGGEVDAETWRRAALELGVNKDVIRGIGLGPMVFGGQTIDERPLTEIEIVGMGMTTEVTEDD